MANLQAISLYTGAGGLDLGLEAAGFRTAIAVEMDADAVRTVRANRDWRVIAEDIHAVSSEQLLAQAKLESGEADLLIGGPPCQPFSKSGYWATGDSGRLDDPRASTLDAYLRVLRDTRPRAFLLENVSGLAYRGKREALDLLCNAVSEINRSQGTDYSFETAVLNAADYGVPQERERLFVVGARDGAPCKFPAATHRPVGVEGSEQLALEGSGKLETYRTAWDAIGDLQDDDDPHLCVRGKWAELLPSIPEGANYLHHTDRGEGVALFGWRRRYWSFLLKLAKRLPSWTITAQPGSAVGPFHWRNRRLSMRELCRLQTFPDNYKVLGERGSYQRQIGNAVPSALAEVLGRAIRRSLFGHDVSAAPTLIPDRRLPVPPAERALPVGDRYLSLAGEHSAHPGTGLGYGALRREAAGD